MSGANVPNEWLLLLGKIDGKLDAITQRLDALAQRQDGHEARIGHLEALAAARATVPEKIEGHEKRIVELETYKRVAIVVGGVAASIMSVVVGLAIKFVPLLLA